MAPTFYDKRTRDYCLSAHPSVTSLCNSSNSPGELKQLLTCTRAGLEAARLGSLPACSPGDTAASGAHTGHREKTQCLPSRTGNVGSTAPREKPQSAAYSSHTKMCYSQLFLLAHCLICPHPKKLRAATFSLK